MKKDELLEFIRKEFKDIEHLFEAKNGDYATGKDALSNFRDAAITCGTTDYQAWFVYFFKHFVALQNWIRTGNMNTDTPKSRIQDMIVYLFLLMALLKENTDYESNDLYQAYYSQFATSPQSWYRLSPELIERYRHGSKIDKETDDKMASYVVPITTGGDNNGR